MILVKCRCGRRRLRYPSQAARLQSCGCLRGRQNRGWWPTEKGWAHRCAT